MLENGSQGQLGILTFKMAWCDILDLFLLCSSDFYVLFYGEQYCWNLHAIIQLKKVRRITDLFLSHFL